MRIALTQLGQPQPNLVKAANYSRLFKVSDSVSITPGIIYLTAPDRDANSTGAVIGALRTTFTF